MRISEIFYSLQGEGFLAGVPSVLVRLTGCPLRCRWCDTKYAWDQTAGAEYRLEKIIELANRHKTRYVVITGGEPMINAQLPDLVKQLKENQKHVTIETAGIAFVPDMPCDLMSISPKLSGSVPYDPAAAAIHEDSRLDIAVLRELIEHYDYQLKFVVDCESDLVEIQQTIEEIANVDPEKVMLMPQAATGEELIEKSPLVAEMCKAAGFAFCHRLHILLWNNQRTT